MLKGEVWKKKFGRRTKYNGERKFQNVGIKKTNYQGWVDMTGFKAVEKWKQ